MAAGGVDEQGVFGQGGFDAGAVASGGERRDHLGPVVPGPTGRCGEGEQPQVGWGGPGRGG